MVNEIDSNNSGNADSFQDEFRKQRHEFILQYYNMAVNDLDRHLKIGWQTIATLSGFVLFLSLGYRGDLPFSISSLAGIAILG
jgi:hypothetical protein